MDVNNERWCLDLTLKFGELNSEIIANVLTLLD
jgi:hypothetical protein